MLTSANRHTAVFLALTGAIGKARGVEDMYRAALDALASGLGVSRSSILLFDPDGVMRFKAVRGLSDAYQRAVEGHTPWTPDTPDPEPIVVADVAHDPSMTEYRPIFDAEGIAALTFVPLVSLDRVIGKFMLYYATPYAPGAEEIQLASVLASQVAFALERTRTEEQARRSEERLRFALDAARMGTWDWDLRSNTVVWSENLERIHGLPAGTFDGTFASYEREVHPEDRARVLASAQRALTDGVPHDVEYRIVAPDGTVRWCEGKGRVEYENGQPARMTGVCMMVTRRKEAELARLAAAEEASRLKDEFLATLSHELRTPLNAILGWTQLLQGSEIPPERLRHAIDVIGRNARLQGQLIEDILDVSRIITGKLEIDRGPISFAQLIDTVVAGATPAADAKHIELRKSVADVLPPLEGDHRRLHQVLANVLSNAVKFTPEGGFVALTCATHGEWLQVQVTDSGIGVEREFLPRMFDRFRQADSRSTRRHGGLGLGLAIAQHLVEQHGGRISADSEGLGRGTTVTIVLPLHASAGLVGVEAAADSHTVDVRLDGRLVIVVDDQRDSREFVGALLEARGARVVQCASAESADEQLRSSDAHMLIADIAMPDVDGYELIRRVRSRGSRVPAIAVTAYARPEDRQQVLAHGYDAYCAKPVQARALLQAVRALV
jgi:PAS domain S-box-containing protein